VVFVCVYVEIVDVLDFSKVLFVPYVKSCSSVLLSQHTADYFLYLFSVENFCTCNLHYSLTVS
jgi:hypothetical protein